MSQTTCCPTCQTLFKVVPDQLRVSEGWVRCGKCSEIFDAHQHLYKEPFAPDAAPNSVQDRSTAMPGSSDTAETADTQKTEPAPLHLKRKTGVDTAVQVARFEKTPIGAPQVPLPSPQDIAGLRAQLPLAPRRPRISKADADADSNEVLFNAPPEATFLRAPKGHVFWGRRWVRISLWLIGIGLSSALALQTVVHQRDHIAATSPTAKPAVEGLCQLLGCRVLPLRQIESMVIDGSTFTELRGNAYRLGFTVKNTAAIDLAMPAIELTLTDPQDRAALRRVFLPAEMGATSAVLGAGAEWVGSLVLSVRTNGASERVAGYRISAIYP